VESSIVLFAMDEEEEAGDFSLADEYRDLLDLSDPAENASPSETSPSNQRSRFSQSFSFIS